MNDKLFREACKAVEESWMGYYLDDDPLYYEFAEKVLEIYTDHALQNAAEEAYKNEVIDTEMEQYVIGPPNYEYTDKEDWINQRIGEWYE